MLSVSILSIYMFMYMLYSICTSCGGDSRPVGSGAVYYYGCIGVMVLACPFTVEPPIVLVLKQNSRLVRTTLKSSGIILLIQLE